MKPLLKWVGGKTQILDTVLQIFPTTMNNYHEPFLGGGSVLLGLLSSSITVTGTLFASDINPYTIALYDHVKRQPQEVITALRHIMREFDAVTGSIVNRKPTTVAEGQTSKESFYYWIRSRFNAASAQERCSPEGAARLLFLNKTCFRGVYREGPHGFNVPYGHYKNAQVYDEAHILAVSAAIQRVVFVCQDFTSALSNVQSGDFVYLDPPYVPETVTSFVGYTANGFSAHAELFARCQQLPAFLLSNADVTVVRQAFPESSFVTRVLSARRAIHSKKPESRTNEVLITRRV